MIDKNQIFDFFIAKGLAFPSVGFPNSIKEYSEPLYEEVQDFIEQFYKNSTKKFSELLYCYLKVIETTPLCTECGDERKFKQFSSGYFDFCSVKCSSNSEKKKLAIESTCLKKYGHRNVAHGEGIKEKIQVSWEEKFKGNPFQNEKIKNKIKLTCTERYGVEYVQQSEEFKNRCKETWIEKYGVDHPWKSDVIKEKIDKTNRERRNSYKWIDHEFENFKMYKVAVWYYSNQNFRIHYYQINPNKVKRSKNTWHLDHIFSIYSGWKYQISPKDISHQNNLQMLWCKENRKKGHKSEMTLDSFYKLIEKDSNK